MLLGILLALIIPVAQAADIDKKPRRQKKRGAKKEQIETKQDSLPTTNAPLVDSSTIHIDRPIQIVDIEPTPRANTPQQIDSVLAMWQRTSTQEAYDNYFNDMLAMSERIDTLFTTTNQDSIYIERMEAMLSPVPLKYNYEVRKAIERYTAKHYEESMGYAYYYFPMIEAEFIKAGIPIELRTLAFVESGLNPLARSRSGAMGIWQFMPETGKIYGLEINSLVDERCNPLLSTRAAAKYLKSMYEQYGDWTLAIASYNTGPRNVNKAIIRCGGEPSNYNGSFWDIYEHLSSETRSYVPLYMGATYAFAYHKAHGMNLVMPPIPLATDIVMVDRPMHLEQVSSTIDVDIEILKMLNPQYTMMIIPATTKEYMLTLPAELISEYWANEEAIHAKDAEYLKEYKVHANLEKKRAEAPPAKYHTVKKGETLGGIAKKYGRTIKQLMTWNNIKNADAIREGQKLRVSAQ
jgi:membrane-bound lytic murein transglycosylase D